MEQDNDPADEPSPRRPYRQGNVGPDGDYIVGKGKPPKHSQFAAGDGRRRGRRPKRQKNFDTEFEEEARRRVSIREGGKDRRVTKLRSTIIRAFDNAGAKGQHQAINTIFNQSARIADKSLPPAQGLSADEDALINDWLAQRMASLAEGDQPGDPGNAPPEAGVPGHRDSGPDSDDG